MQGYNFTQRMRVVLATARDEADTLNHEYVGTEHLLLALVHEGDRSDSASGPGIAMTVLRTLGVDPEAVANRILGLVQRGQSRRMSGPDLPYTSRAKKVLELAMKEARELNHSYVGTEHLLLGLVREEKGIAAQVLAVSGLRLEHARAEVQPRS
jgi:ATP-dependent Clp protease ATP-binding subunit ClpC